MKLSPRFKEAFKTALAMVLAYGGIALSMDGEKPMWAAFAVAVSSLATAGQSIKKGALRMLGTLLTAVFSLTLLALFARCPSGPLRGGRCVCTADARHRLAAPARGPFLT